MAFPGRLFAEAGSVLALVPLLLLSAASVPVAQHAALAAARGSPARLSTVARAALSRLPAYLLLAAVLALQVLLIGLVCVAAALVGRLLLAALVGAPLLALAFVLNVLAPPAWAAEGLGAVASIERSPALTRGVRWRILARIVLSAVTGSALRWQAGGWAGAGVTNLSLGTLGQGAAEASAGAITVGVATAAYCQVAPCTGAGAVPASLDRAEAPSSSM